MSENKGRYSPPEVNELDVQGTITFIIRQSDEHGVEMYCVEHLGYDDGKDRPVSSGEWGPVSETRNDDEDAAQMVETDRLPKEILIRNFREELKIEEGHGDAIFNDLVHLGSFLHPFRRETHGEDYRRKPNTLGQIIVFEDQSNGELLPEGEIPQPADEVNEIFRAQWLPLNVFAELPQRNTYDSLAILGDPAFQEILGDWMANDSQPVLD